MQVAGLAWRVPYVIPRHRITANILVRLNAGEVLNRRDGTMLILDLARSLLEHTMYPSRAQYTEVVEALFVAWPQLGNDTHALLDRCVASTRK